MARKPTRQRGEIEARASGSLRVRVYAGVDALTGRRHYLTESVPAGPKAYAEAEKIRRRLVNQVDEQRNPRTKVPVNQLMDHSSNSSTSRRRHSSGTSRRSASTSAHSWGIRR